MAMLMSQVCDFGKDHPAALSSEVKVGDTVLQFDVCDAHQGDLIRALTDLGYEPARARVGKDTRGAYLGASGVPFTALAVRNWLLEQGRTDVPPTGRLPQAELDAYAREH